MISFSTFIFVFLIIPIVSVSSILSQDSEYSQHYYLDPLVHKATLYGRNKNDTSTFSPAKVFGYDVYENWSKLSIFDRLEYLIDIREFSLLYDEFHKYKEPLSDEAYYNNKGIEIDNFEQVLQEFQGSDIISFFFANCDANSDGMIYFSEYIICRGDFDVHGNGADKNEYEARASVLFSDHEKLLSSSSYQPNKYKYDEFGIIID